MAVVDLKLPNGYTYNIYIEVLENEKTVLRGVGTITLKGTASEVANPFANFDMNKNSGEESAYGGYGIEDEKPEYKEGGECTNLAPRDSSSFGAVFVFLMIIIATAAVVAGVKYARKGQKGSNVAKNKMLYVQAANSQVQQHNQIAQETNSQSGYYDTYNSWQNNGTQ